MNNHALVLCPKIEKDFKFVLVVINFLILFNFKLFSEVVTNTLKLLLW